MAEGKNDGFEGEHMEVTEGASFSQLLFEADEAAVGGLSGGCGGGGGGGSGVVHSHHTTYNYTHSSSFSTHIKPPQMLCFGNYDDDDDLHHHTHGGDAVGFSPETAKISGVTCSDSSSVSSTSNTLSKSKNKRRNGFGPGRESVQCASTVSTTAVATQRASKKTKPENPTSTGTTKRKEKLGERIAALQQLVSPYGKTDTASVLHEAMGYIRFLHDQVQVLCSPYLQLQLPPDGEVEVDEKEGRKELRSRGLCLVPVEYTMHVANNNGADFWSSAMGMVANDNNHHNVPSATQN